MDEMRPGQNFGGSDGSFHPPDHPRIRKIDINPLLASPGHLIALDARIVLFDGKVTEDALPRPAASAHQ